MTRRWIFPALLLALAAVKGLVWTVALPPWYGPDEPSHFAYVQVLALEHRVPQHAAPRLDGRDTPWEIHCSYHNLGFRLNGPFFAEPFFGQDPNHCTQPGTAASQLPEVTTNPAGGYFPLYYAAAVVPYDLAAHASVETRVAAVRLLRVLLGIGFAGFSYLAGLWAFGGRRPLALAVGAVATLQPIASQSFAIVNNDALLVALGAAFFWRFFRALARGLAVGDALWLGGLAGAAYLAKPQGILLAALIPIPLVIAWRDADGRLRQLIRPALAAAGALGILLAFGLVGNGLLQGHAIPQAAPGLPGFHGLRGYVGTLVANHFGRLYWLLIVSPWGHFSWVSAALPPPAFWVISAVCGAALIGLVIRLRPGTADRRPLVAALASVGVVGALLLVLEALIYRQSGELILQGRSFLEILPAFAIALVGGLTALWPRRCERVAAAGIVAAALALNVFSLMVLLETFFG